MNLQKIVKEFRDGILDCTQFGNDPTGMCFAVCAPLQGYLYAACGMNTKLEQADGIGIREWCQQSDVLLGAAATIQRLQSQSNEHQS